MAETVIDLPSDVIAEIEKAAARVGVNILEVRKPGEFTAEEFGVHMGFGVRHAYTFLKKGMEEGLFERREWRNNGHKTFLYRNVSHD